MQKIVLRLDVKLATPGHFVVIFRPAFYFWISVIKPIKIIKSKNALFVMKSALFVIKSALFVQTNVEIEGALNLCFLNIFA